MKQYLAISLLVLGLLLAGCPGNGTPQECPTTEQLVCGADGTTYTNPCFAQKAGVSVAHQGACTSPSGCADGDGGKDIFTSGSVLGPDGQYNDDYCESKTTVVEYFCSNGAVLYETFPCPAGYECNGGKCELAPCTDSDGGANFGVKGTTVSGALEEFDVCLQNGSLKEYFCKDGALAYQVVECPQGQHCLVGACVEQECEDSDGGQDTLVAGTTTKGDASQEDSCFDSKTVKEYYCEDGIIKSKNIACDLDKICQDGACVAKPQCADSDGGKDKFVLGTATYEGVSKTDACYSETTLIEYFCEDGIIKEVKLVCGLGYECSLGKCVEQECTEEDLDEAPVRYEIFSDDEAKLYEGEAIEVEVGSDKFILKLNEVIDNETVEFALYASYEDYLDNDDICDNDQDLILGDDAQEVCDEALDLGLDAIEEGDGYVEISTGEDFNFIQYLVLEGITYEGSGCPDDEIDKETSNFYPPLSEALEGKKFKMLGQLATIDNVDVAGEVLSIEFDGEDYDLEDGDTVELDGEDYQVDIRFTDWGVDRIVVELD